ncbi:hypothetical protein TWF694_001484 [Orbilia ellipsospora]|uniref:Uncharacterized protein n=1 Tax=Orbilia ellipsospora TaxID=2528407 RepID=A0AAV9XRR1_9PEZI
MPSKRWNNDASSFEFWYTRSRFFCGDDTSTHEYTKHLQKKIIQSSECDPTVFENELNGRFGWSTEDIIAFYELLSSRLVYKHNLFQITNMSLPQGEHIIWFAV